MERRKNLPVLPSNAPALSPRTSILSSQSEDLISPLSSQVCQKYNRGPECKASDLDHIRSASPNLGYGAYSSQSGILRATSGNASVTPLEPSPFDTKFKGDGRYETRSTSAFVNPPYHTAQAAIRLTQKKDRRNIWQRWELQSPRYLAYRRKARSKKAGTKEDVWPDDVEEAFQIAIRLYAKRGRTKDELNGRQAGGNEFISDWIEKQTGHRRCRKQISSHIQTLKGFLGDVPAWMDLVTAWPPGKQEKAKVIKHGSTAYDELDFASPNKTEHVRSMHRRESRNPRLPSSVTVGSDGAQDPTIRGIQFDMHLSNEATSTKTHIYTSIQSEIGSAARPLEQVPQWQDMFPHLAKRYNEGRINCPLFLFESRLRLIDDIRPGLSLGVEFAIDFAEGAYFHDWRSLTRVHKQDITPQYFDDSEFEETWDRLECLESNSGQSDIQLTIPFKSKWWVKLFSSIISKRDAARNARDRKGMKWAEAYPAAYLRELSIMQELWATPRGSSPQRPQRMATLLWTFSQTRNGEAATTTWRPLTLSTSASPYQVQEPILRNIQPSMNLDSTLSESMGPLHTQPAQEQASDFYHSHGHHAGLFSATSEALLTSQISECDTSPTTPILDYTSSFPSSTSASFPSSISNASGCYPSHHGSSFDSQDSTRSSYTQSLESSFHSQNLTHDPQVVYGMPHCIANHSLKPHDPNEPFHETQDLLYTSQPGSLYGSMSEYHSSSFDPHSSINDSTMVDNATHHGGFTGRALQFSYVGQQRTAEHELSPTDDGGFQAPLIAPRANLLPVQQVGECLQSFEAWIPEQEQQPQESPQHVGRGNSDENMEGQVCGNGQRQSASYLHHHHHQLFDQQRQTQQQNDFQPQGQQQQQPQLRSPFPAVHQTGDLQRQQHHEEDSSDSNTKHSVDDDNVDEETRRQRQLQYLHDAQDHWQQTFHSSTLWTTVPGADGGLLDQASQEPQPQVLGHEQGRVMGEMKTIMIEDDNDDSEEDAVTIMGPPEKKMKKKKGW